MSQTNNNIGQNFVPNKLQDDAHFDLAPTAGTDVIAGLTGVIYDQAAIKAVLVALGTPYTVDASLFVATDDLIEVEADLKPLNGRGIDEGLATNPISTATTATAIYINGNGLTVIDGGGGRNDGEESTTILPSSFAGLFVENGSVVTLHVTFQKA